MEAETDRSELWPVLHWVPVANCWTTDHWPDAQRWNEVPPMQFQVPSVEHEPFRAPSLELPEEGGVDGAASVADGAAGSGAAAELGCAGASLTLGAGAGGWEGEATGALSAGAVDEELESELEPPDPEPAELEPDPVVPSPANLAVPVQADWPSGARLDS